MKKILSVLLLTFVLVGCAPVEKGTGNTISVKHGKGTAHVDVESGLNRLVVFDMGILDIIDKLEIGAELALPVASVPSYLSDYKDSFNAGAIKEPNIEDIFEFDPDLIFISGRQESFYNVLKEIAPTIFVEVDSTNFLVNLEDNIQMIAKLFDKVDEASAHFNEITGLIDETKALTKNLSDKALILLYNDTFSAFGGGSRFGFIHDVLGIKEADENISISTHGFKVGPEYITSLDPEMIFVIDRTIVVSGSDASNIFTNSIYKNLKALNNDKVVYLDAESWYLVSGGISSTKTMINEVKAVFK